MSPQLLLDVLKSDLRYVIRECKSFFSHYSPLTGDSILEGE